MSIRVVGPDADGLLWIHADAGALRGAISVRAGSIAGRAFAAAAGAEAGRDLCELVASHVADAPAGSMLCEVKVYDESGECHGYLPDAAQRAMSAEHALAQLRHLYAQLLRGHVEPQSEAARFLLGPAIEELERLQADLVTRPTESEVRRLRSDLEEARGALREIEIRASLGAPAVEAPAVLSWIAARSRRTGGKR